MEELASRNTAHGHEGTKQGVGGAVLGRAEFEKGGLQKNTATLNSDTILTARLGCFARTLAASSCTEIEIAIRRAMSTSSATNEASPDPSDVLGVGFPNHPLRLSSLDATLNVRGTAANTMLSTRTTATSSSSDICASCAESSSSLPMPKETEKARSEPRDPSAAAVSVMLPEDTDHVSQVVYFESVELALREVHYLPGRLAWQAPAMGGASLVLRRLFVAPRGVRRANHGAHSGPIRARHRKHAYEAELESGGTVFGCTLGNLMHHCRGRKHKLMHAMRVARKVLQNAGDALGHASGNDRDVLVRALACHRVLRMQGRKLGELKRAPDIDYKMGHVGVVVGASAAILVAFECMSVDAADTEGLGSQLMHCLRDAHTAVASWRLPSNLDNDMRDARMVEVRALERARMGVCRAQQLCGGLSDADAMRLQLDFYRRAVWPMGCIDDDAHGDILERIGTGELVDEETHPRAKGLNAPGIVSLAALPVALSTTSSGDGASSHSGSSSSAWSFASSTSDIYARVAVPLFYPDLAQLQATLNASRLSDAAKSATRPYDVIENCSF